MLKRVKGNFEVLDPKLASQATCDLEAQGFAMLPKVFSSAEINALRSAVEKTFIEFSLSHRSEKLSFDAEDEFRHELFNKSSVLQDLLGKPELLAVVEPLLGNDCHVIANTAWKNSPSDFAHGGQKWHIDAGPHIPLPGDCEWPNKIPFPVFVIATHIFLQDCSIDDGPTGVIPHSHKSGRIPPRDRAYDDSLSFSGNHCVPLTATAGDVVFFVSDVWHRRMPTRQNSRGRFFIQIHYGRRDIAQRVKTTDEVNHVDVIAEERAKTERQRTLIGLHSPYFYDG